MTHGSVLTVGVMPRINHEVLAWARERAGVSLDEAARSAGLASARLQEMEAGNLEPSRRQLTRLAEKYRRPILAFYLPAPPPAAPPTHDFRTVRDRAPESEAILDALVRNVMVRQTLVRNALEDMEEESPLDFVGSVRVEQGAEFLAQRMRERLNFNLVAYRSRQNVTAAFALLREQAEKIGVYVLLMGNLGHHTSNISANVFRGLTLVDPVAPFVVINENDSRAAWSFTLVHELAHVFLGQSGISGYDGNERIEQLCDEAAALFLLRRVELQEIPTQNASLDDILRSIGTFAEGRKVSRKMVAYNLLKARRITDAIYEELAARLDAERNERQPRGEDEGGPNYYIVRRHRVGRALTQLVARMIANRALTATKAGRVLGVRPTAVARMTQSNDVRAA